MMRHLKEHFNKLGVIVFEGVVLFVMMIPLSVLGQSPHSPNEVNGEPSVGYIDNLREDYEWVYFHSDTVIYDANGRIFEDIDWRVVYENYAYQAKRQYLYNENDDIVTRTHSENHWGNGFENETMFTYVYDAEANLISLTSQRWGSELVWVNYNRDVYQYDIENNQTSSIQFTWDDSIWIKTDSTFTFFNQGNVPDSTRVYEWSEDSLSWAQKSRFYYAYNENYQLVESVSQGVLGGSWYNSRRLSYVYDDRGNLIDQTLETGSYQSWSNHSRKLFEYDSTGNLLLTKHQSPYGDTWHTVVRDRNYYDDESNLIFEVNEQWNGSQWYEWWRMAYSYTAEGHLAAEIQQRKEDTTWTNSLKREFTYNSVYQEVSTSHWDWAEVVSVADNPILLTHTIGLDCFPNPTNGETSIKIKFGSRALVSIEIYDINGRFVDHIYTGYLNPGDYYFLWQGKQISGTNASTGLYICRISSEYESVSKKLLLIK